MVVMLLAVLLVAAATGGPDGSVIMQPCTDGARGTWQLVNSTTGDSFRIALSHSVALGHPACVDLHGSAAQGALQLQSCTTGGSDERQLLRSFAGGSICTISPAVQCDGQPGAGTAPRLPCCLTVAGGSTTAGAAVNLYAGVVHWPCKPACVNQQFDRVPLPASDSGGGGVELRAKNEGLCVTATQPHPSPAPGPPAPGPPPPPSMGIVSPVTCMVRRLALEYSQHMLNASAGFLAADIGARLLHEALALGECGGPAPPQSARLRGAGRPSLVTPRVVGLLIHVSTTGSDDTGDGSQGKPLATLAGARDKLRSLSAGWTAKTCCSTTVLISAGVYHLGRTLELNATDGGLSASCGVIYRAFDEAGAAVVISGGVPLTGLSWQREPKNGKVWSVVLPPSAPDSFESLFDDAGLRLTRARWPNGSPETDLQPTGYALAAQWLPPKSCPVGTQTTVAHPQRFLNGTGYCENFPAFSIWLGGTAVCRGFSPAKMFDETVRQDISIAGPPSGFALDWADGWENRSWRGCDGTNGSNSSRCGGVVHVLNSNAVKSTDGPWGNFQYELASLQRKGSDTQSADCASGGCIHFGRGGWQVHSDGPSDEGPGTPTYFVENIYEELDQAGEWWAGEKDGTERSIYLIPNTTDGLPPPLLVAPAMKTILRIAGTQQTPVRHLTIRGLTFAHSDVTYMEQYTPTGPGDWGIFRGGAMMIEGAEQVAVERCHLRRLNGNAIFMSGYVKESNVTGCYFESTGDSCVAVVQIRSSSTRRLVTTHSSTRSVAT